MVVVVVVVVIIIMEDNGADDDDEKKTLEEEDKDKEEKEEEKEEEKDSQRELSLLLSKCHAALKRARETVAEASVMRFDDDGDDDVDDTQKNAAALTDDDGQKRTLEMMHSMAGRVERMVEECKETLEEIERKTTHLSTKTYRGGDADAKEEERRRQEFVRAMRMETRTMRRDVEEVLKHAESARKGERRQLIPEPMKEAPKTKDETREEKIQQQQQQQQHHHQPEDRFLFWKTSAKTYLRKAKKKMDSVATQTKNAVKKYARSKSYDDAKGQQKETERYSDAQRQREMREEEEIRRVRRYGYESTKSTNNLEENVDEDDEDAQRRALFAKIAPTITPIPSTSSLPNNTTTAKNSYDIKAARNSTLSANRSAIALENSLHHAERAERAGRDTLENLRRQRETLQRTSGHVQSATRTADENAKLVKKMSHWSRLGC